MQRLENNTPKTIKNEQKVKTGLIQKALERITETPSPEKIMFKKEESPYLPSNNEKKEIIIEKKTYTNNNFKENSNEKKKNINDECDKICLEEISRVKPSNQPKMRSDDYFLQKRKEKIKEKIGVKENTQKTEVINEFKEEKEQSFENGNENNEEELVEIKREGFNPIYQRASLAVQLDEKNANLEEIKGLERETVEGNKVMFEWINKNKNHLEKSQKMEPILKKKENQEDIQLMEALEKHALKKIEEKISSYLAKNSDQQQKEGIIFLTQI